MQDYYNYDFTISIDDLKQVVINAYNNGCKPLLYFNGMYYDIVIGDESNEK